MNYDDLFRKVGRHYIPLLPIQLKIGTIYLDIKEHGLCTELET